MRVTVILWTLFASNAMDAGMTDTVGGDNAGMMVAGYDVHGIEGEKNHMDEHMDGYVDGDLEGHNHKDGMHGNIDGMKDEMNKTGMKKDKDGMRGDKGNMDNNAVGINNNKGGPGSSGRPNGKDGMTGGKDEMGGKGKNEYDMDDYKNGMNGDHKGSGYGKDDNMGFQVCRAFNVCKIRSDNGVFQSFAQYRKSVKSVIQRHRKKAKLAEMTMTAKLRRLTNRLNQLEKTMKKSSKKNTDGNSGGS